MSIFFALLAAFANAVSVAVQHIASTRSPPTAKGFKLVIYLFTNVMWWLGWIALVGGFVFQAAALHNGLLSIVQVLLVTELVFSLIIRAVWIHQTIGPVTWGAAIATCVAIGVFVAASQPEGGTATPDSRAWAVSVGVFGGLTLLAALLARWGGPTRRAALYAFAAATSGALLATFMKAMTDTITEFGIGGMFTHWPVYATAVAGLANVVFTQAALHAGPLSVSQPLMVIETPIASIILSVTVYGERFTGTGAAIAVAAVAFVVLCVAVVVLTRTAPPTMEADQTASAVPAPA